MKHTLINQPKGMQKTSNDVRHRMLDKYKQRAYVLGTKRYNDGNTGEFNGAQTGTGKPNMGRRHRRNKVIEHMGNKTQQRQEHRTDNLFVYLLSYFLSLCYLPS